GPASQLVRGRLPDRGEPGRRGHGGLLLRLLGGLLAAEVLLAEAAFALGVPDRLQQPADLAHVIPPGRDPGPGRQDQGVAGIDGPEALASDAGPLRSVGQLAGVPVGVVPGCDGAPSKFAGRELGLAELAAILAEPTALARDLTRSGQHLAALVFDPSLRLVLPGVLQPGHAALQHLAFVAPG